MPGPGFKRHLSMLCSFIEIFQNIEYLSQATVRQRTIIELTCRIDTRHSGERIFSCTVNLARLEATPSHVRNQICLQPPHSFIQCSIQVLLENFQSFRLSANDSQYLGSKNGDQGIEAD